MPNQVKTIIQEHNLKATPQRINIYNVMTQLGHASADMVYSHVKDLYPTITVATIYNVLQSFSDAGLIARRFSSNNKMYFDINTYDHCHLYDTEKHTFKDLDNKPLMENVKQFVTHSDIPDFEFDTIDIQITGHSKTIK